VDGRQPAFIFILLNALMKKLSHELDPWLVGFLRYLVGAVVMLGAGAAARSARAALECAALAIRAGLFHAGGMMLWFAALPFVTLAELTAIGFTGPDLHLPRRVAVSRRANEPGALDGGARRLLRRPDRGPAVGAGGFDGISRGMLLMLASAPVFAGSFLVAKTLTRHDPSEVVVLWQHLWYRYCSWVRARTTGHRLRRRNGVARRLRIPRRGRSLLHDARVFARPTSRRRNR
jgi:hypothetical protein